MPVRSRPSYTKGNMSPVNQKGSPTMERQWSELSADEKRDIRFQRWLNPENVQFVSTEAKARYQRKLQRFIDAICLKEPDRVPVMAGAGRKPAHYSGFTVKDVMYDAKKMESAWLKYIHAFDHDTLPSAGMVQCGEALDLLQSKKYKWAGHGLADDHAPQYLESELLLADEWDEYLKHPADFNIRKYLPRLFGAAEPLAKLPPLAAVGGRPGTLGAFADPEIQAAFKAMADADAADAKWHQVVAKVNAEGAAHGLPTFSVLAKGGAPLDNVGAALRGTKGLVKDMFKQPERLIEYLEQTVAVSIRDSVALADITNIPVMLMPLHRGADGWMSEAQFKKFYWPYMRRVLMGQIEEGLVPCYFVEGAYNTRLEIINDVPKGKVVWFFDQTDIFKAKEILGANACIMGNVPASLLATGTTGEVKAHCRELIERVGAGGGYILAPGATSDSSKIENLNAMLEAAKEYGVYRK
jgi:uroporphyrinogen-III decarboxylase